MDLIEERFPVRELREVSIDLLRTGSFYHPVRPRLETYTSDALYVPTPNLDAFSHGNPVRRCRYLFFEAMQIEGPILASYCPQCQILFYAHDTEQYVAEFAELERIYALKSPD